MNINFCQTDNMHFGQSIALELFHIINGYAKILDIAGQNDTFILVFEKDFKIPLMNDLNVSYMAMVLVPRL